MLSDSSTMLYWIRSRAMPYSNMSSMSKMHCRCCFSSLHRCTATVKIAGLSSSGESANVLRMSPIKVLECVAREIESRMYRRCCVSEAFGSSDDRNEGYNSDST